ncbi:MAG: hypothetical protein ACD_56C00165G0002 [uncultured bacterium]|nr:MAG: hypothetical protein ACD_56C00165G0002 [uncultured bacterium]
MKNFLKNQREALAIFCYIGLVALLFYVVIFPLIGGIDGVRDRIQEEQIKQESSRKQLNDLPKIQEQYATLQNSNIDGILLDKDDAVILIEKLEQLASQSGNDISITVQEQTNQKTTNTKAKKGAESAPIIELPSANYLSLKIVLNGDLNTIGRFIKMLESFEYYCDVMDMQIKNMKEASASKSGTTNPFDDKKNQSTNLSAITGNKLEASFGATFYTK